MRCHCRTLSTNLFESIFVHNTFFVSFQGHNSPREFIVTQGPLHSTRDDFWRMCWESNSRSIIMLTRCFEKGREKCDQYWPTDTDPLYYGDINVQMLNSTQFSDWITTEFMVCRGNEQRIIRHFHFVTWPDFGGLCISLNTHFLLW